MSLGAHAGEHTNPRVSKEAATARSGAGAMNKTAISVAMATYNGGRFLQEQLGSLARQTLLPFELVVCDDGSTDGTLDLLLRFQAGAPFPVRIHSNETRLGAGFNFLSALGRCTGDLVAFCDQDDIWKEQKLSVCAEVLRDPRITLVSHSALVFSSQPSFRPWRQPNHAPRVLRNYRDLPVQQWTLLGFSMVLRRAVLDKAPIPEYSAALSSLCAYDVWATIAALMHGRVVLLPDELAFHRLHEENVTLRPPREGRARLAPDPLGLERGAENWAGLAQFIRYAASFYDPSARVCFGEYVRQIECYGNLCGARALLHRACGDRRAAWRILVRMLATGSYAPRKLGTRALVRDALLATCSPAREQATEGPPA